ncbi:MAG: nucleotide exchange factor GrpE [bacterium]|nr:nucleotide exchange factor GrpE [bacterium]
MPDKKGAQIDDIVFEEEGASAGFELKKLREKLKECQRQKDEYLAGWQRAKADLVNARNEEEKRSEEFRKYAELSLIEDILPVVDGFENAFKEESWKKVDKAWQNGIKYLYNQFISVLKEHNLEPIDAVGKKFNPEEHEAFAEVSVDDEKDDGIVIEELRKGYKMRGKVVRPAQVKVGKYKA